MLGWSIALRMSNSLIISLSLSFLTLFFGITGVTGTGTLHGPDEFESLVLDLVDLSVSSLANALQRLVGLLEPR